MAKCLKHYTFHKVYKCFEILSKIPKKMSLISIHFNEAAFTGDRPKGAGGAAAPPRKNNSACRNENRVIVSTGMKILSEQKLEVCFI